MARCLFQRSIAVKDIMEPTGYSYINVPCGKCLNCLRNKQNEWVFRCMLEYYAHDYPSYFLTLTYKDDFIPENKSLDKKDVDRFLHAMRTALKRKGRDNFSYLCVGEYGRENNRPHYHLLIFGVPLGSVNDAYTLFLNFWKKGFVYVEFLTHKNVKYTTKYLLKLDTREHLVRPYMTYSVRPALGYRYLTKHPDYKSYIENLPVGLSGTIVVLPNGYKYKLPSTWKRKFLSESNKRKLLSYASKDSMTIKKSFMLSYRQKQAKYNEHLFLNKIHLQFNG